VAVIPTDTMAKSIVVVVEVTVDDFETVTEEVSTSVEITV
jgi:hypothetical protein